MTNDNFLENLSYFFVKLAKFFVKLAIFFVLVYVIGMQLFSFGRRLFYERAVDTGDGKEIEIEIDKKDTADTIAQKLENAGLIDDTLAFRFRAKIYKTKFTPNVYNLKTNMTIKNMLDIFDNPSSEYVKSTTNPNENEVYQLSPEEDETEESENN